jgi:hypothetical protein
LLKGDLSEGVKELRSEEVKRELAAFIFSSPPPIPACKDRENPRKSTTFPFSVFNSQFSILHEPSRFHAVVGYGTQQVDTIRQG